MAFAAARPSVAQEKQEKPLKLPEGPGLAAKYPGDAGIAADPNVIFVEQFEGFSVQLIGRNWDGASVLEAVSLSKERPLDAGGNQSLLMTHVGGKGDGTSLYRRLEPGYDQLFVRFYVKFDSDCNPIYHFFHFGGYVPSSAYSQTGARIQSHGRDRLVFGIEPHGDRWMWDYYSHWAESRGSPPRGQTWGNSFSLDNPLSVARGEWICVEAMVKLNDVGDSNGEMALWLNGKLVSHFGKGFPKGKWIYDKFVTGEGGESIRWSDERQGPENVNVAAGGEPFEGFRWRLDDKLKLNYIWLLIYITKTAPEHESKIWFDNIVVAKEYVGPLPRSGATRTYRVGAAPPKAPAIRPLSSKAE